VAEWDIPNWITLIVEVVVAIFAVVISWKFYTKGKKQQEKIQEIETEQTDLIKEMKPIIEKQGKEIERREEEARIHRLDIISSIRIYLSYSSFNLKEIEQAKQEPDIDHRISTIKALAGGIDNYLNAIDGTIKTNRKSILEKEYDEIDMALTGIRHTKNFCQIISIRTYQDLEHIDIQKHIRRIDMTLEYLPDPDSLNNTSH